MDCDLEKPLSEFRKVGRRCRECWRKKDRAYYKANREQVLAKNRRWSNTVHIEESLYQALLLVQKGRCALCKKKPKKGGRRLAVDHCHKTGKIRMLLCTRCNMGLGYFDDSPELLRAAANYVEECR